jgi:hypothetical protein
MLLSSWTRASAKALSHSFVIVSRAKYSRVEQAGLRQAAQAAHCSYLSAFLWISSDYLALGAIALPCEARLKGRRPELRQAVRKASVKRQSEQF